MVCPYSTIFLIKCIDSENIEEDLDEETKYEIDSHSQSDHLTEHLASTSSLIAELDIKVNNKFNVLGQGNFNS